MQRREVLEDPPSEPAIYPTTSAQLRGDTPRALAGDAARRRSEHASGRVGGLANTLKRLLALAGRTVEPAQFDRPRLSMLPQHLRTEVLDIYQGFGGVQAEPQLYPGSWDVGCDGIAVELDEDLHFNRYRGRTLRQPSYPALPNFPTKLYVCMCTRHEAQCLSKGRSQARWTSPSTEKQFGPAAPRGDLTGNGAPRWKQRALYDFMKDLAPLVGLGTVARVSVWDAVPLGGSDVLVDRVLRGVAEKEAALALSRLIDARATTSPG